MRAQRGRKPKLVWWARYYYCHTIAHAALGSDRHMHRCLCLTDAACTHLQQEHRMTCVLTTAHSGPALHLCGVRCWHVVCQVCQTELLMRPCEHSTDSKPHCKSNWILARLAYRFEVGILVCSRLPQKWMSHLALLFLSIGSLLNHQSNCKMVHWVMQYLLKLWSPAKGSFWPPFDVSHQMAQQIQVLQVLSRQSFKHDASLAAKNFRLTICKSRSLLSETNKTSHSVFLPFSCDASSGSYRNINFYLYNAELFWSIFVFLLLPWSQIQFLSLFSCPCLQLASHCRQCRLCWLLLLLDSSCSHPPISCSSYSADAQVLQPFSMPLHCIVTAAVFLCVFYCGWVTVQESHVLNLSERFKTYWETDVFHMHWIITIYLPLIFGDPQSW